MKFDCIGRLGLRLGGGATVYQKKLKKLFASLEKPVF
jgi:hypothetical protein